MISPTFDEIQSREPDDCEESTFYPVGVRDKIECLYTDFDRLAEAQERDEHTPAPPQDAVNGDET